MSDAVVIEEPVADEEETQQQIPSTRAIFALLLAAGSLVLFFSLFTVNHRTESEVQEHRWAQRAHYGLDYWMTKGWFDAAGLPVRPVVNGPTAGQPYYYRSSTGAYMLSGLMLEKIWTAATGHYGWRALAVHHQVISLLSATLLGLLAFRIVLRLGLLPLHAFVIAVVTECVFFTFPDNLLLYWEMTEMQWTILFALAYLLVEERLAGREETRSTNVLRAGIIFVLSYFSITTGAFFVAAWIATRLIAGGGTLPRTAVVRLLFTHLLPFAAAVSLFALQLTWVRHLHPDVPTYGSTIMFRSGFDGATDYYIDHSEVLYGRDPLLPKAAQKTERGLRRPWLFVAGLIAVLFLFVAYAVGRMPLPPVIAVASLAGTYILYASVFSQSFVIHPQLYDPILAAPLILAIFAVVPAYLETVTRRTGAFVLLAVFGGFVGANANMREYAVRFAPQKAGTAKSGAAAARPAATPVYGTWKSVPWAAGNFTANKGEWTVESQDQSVYSFTYLGPNTMVVSFFMQGTDVTDTPSVLQIAIPDGKMPARSMGTTCRVRDAGGEFGGGFVAVQSGSGVIRIQRMDAKPWKKTSADNTVVFGTITFEVR